MMGIATAFVLVPAGAACVVAWFLRNWALAGAVGAGALALAALLLTLGPGGGVPFGLPLLVGVGVVGLVSAVHLGLSPDGSPWMRMTWALLVTTGLGLFLLLQSLSEVA